MEGRRAKQHAEILQIVGRYVDLCLVSSEDQSSVISLHALNHAMRTRKLVISNKKKLDQLVKDKMPITDEIIEATRDQGLARPKVLILVPMKKDAHKIIRKMIRLMFGKKEKSYVANLQKFEDEYGDDGNRVHEKRAVSEEYKKLMSGNVDDCLRLGIGLAKKALKLYTPFEDADILLCSPIGLRMIIGDSTDAKREFDFLSSIEVLIVDKANILLMQNWEHLQNIFQTINTIPTKVVSDITRVRQWSLNNQGKFYRQTVLFSGINFTELHALSAFCHNFSGMVTVTPVPRSTVKELKVPIFQQFHRLVFEDAEKQADNRFNYFVNRILPNLNEQTLIFIPSYFDFVRLRNYMKKENISFVQVHEYADKGKVSKARNQFITGKKRMMLLTERFYFFFRYGIKGIKSLVFYQLPVNPEFYAELVNLSQPDGENILSRIIYCQHSDLIRMQNIFGAKVTKELMNSEEKLHAMIGE